MAEAQFGGNVNEKIKNAPWEGRKKNTARRSVGGYVLVLRTQHLLNGEGEKTLLDFWVKKRLRSPGWKIHTAVYREPRSKLASVELERRIIPCLADPQRLLSHWRYTPPQSGSLK